jgi:uncharacterized protein
MAFVWASFFLSFLGVLLLLHLFGLPANWLILAALGFWNWGHADMAAGWFFFAVLIALCVIGELVEFAAQLWGARQFGGSKRGAWAAILGAIIGGVMGAPFFFGLGALPGSLIGAFTASLLVELSQGYSLAAARHAAWGAMWNKIFGMVVKVGLGVLMISLSFAHVWPK